MGCGICCLKCLMILFNVIFGIIGTLFLAVGIFVMVGLSKFIEPTLESAFSSVNGLGSQLGVSGFSTGTLDISKLGTILNPVAIMFIVMGAFLLFMCILGSVGLCCKVQCVLWVYAAILLALFLAQLILVILFFVGTLDATIRAKMLETIETKYVRSDSFDIYSQSWNLMHVQLECCGLDGYTDFDKATAWDKKWTVSGTDVIMRTPLSCCKRSASDHLCAKTPTAANNYYTTGCWEQLIAELQGFNKIMLGVICAILGIQLLCAIGAIVIGLKMKKDEEYA